MANVKNGSGAVWSSSLSLVILSEATDLFLAGANCAVG